MELEEAKVQFKGCTVKNVGYHPDQETQFLYKSEVNKRARIICLFNNQPYSLPADVQDTLRDYQKQAEAGSVLTTVLPQGIRYANEKFIVPSKYFVNMHTTEFPKETVSLPVVEILRPTTAFTTPAAPSMDVVLNASEDQKIFDKAHKIIKDYPLSNIKTISGISYYDDVDSFLVDNVNLLTASFTSETPSEGDLPKLIANLILLNKQRNVRKAN